MQVFNNFFEILLAPTEPKNLILLNFPKKAYHAHPPRTRILKNIHPWT